VEERASHRQAIPLGLIDEDAIDRRRFIKRAALTAAWVTPVVLTVTSSAHAATCTAGGTSCTLTVQGTLKGNCPSGCCCCVVGTPSVNQTGTCKANTASCPAGATGCL
jgi:hypothetical protein